MEQHVAAKPLVLVTGSSGLIGSRVVRDLERDYRVVGLDVRPPDMAAGTDFIAVDLTDDDDAARAFETIRERHGSRIASMIHLAAYYDFAGDPSPMYQKLTVEGTERVLRALKRFEQVEQFVFTSTMLVMEPAKDTGDIITETSPMEDEPWAYPHSKIQAEATIRAERGDIPAVILRIAGVYDSDGNSIPITRHIARIYEKTFESYFFPGNRDHGTPYVHLNDLVACFRHVVEHRADGPPFAVYLIAEPDLMSHNELQDALGELIHGREWPTLRVPKFAAKAGAWALDKMSDDAFIKPWMIDVADDHYPIVIRRAVEDLGWKPQHRLRYTLPEMVRRLKQDPVQFYERNKLPLPKNLEEARTEEHPAEEQAAGAHTEGRVAKEHTAGARGREEHR